jgi:hypothetical protein
MRKVSLFAVLVLLGWMAPALAGKPAKKQKHKGRDTTLVSFSIDERTSVQSFFVEKHGKGNCPPGLAKKNNGCLPPGQAKKRYAVGHAVPSTITVEVLPAELSVRIGPPPAGYRYAVIDGDVVKLAIGTLLVVDAIEGLVQ